MSEVLFVTPPSRQGVYQSLSRFAAIEPPVWSGLLATALLRRGFSVQILDAEALGMSTLQCAEEIRRRKPGLAAFSIYGHQPSASTQCMPAAVEVLGFLKGSGIPTLAFGTHPSAMPMTTLKEGFDYVAEGEGFVPLVLLLANMRAVKKPGGVFTVPGLWHHEGTSPPNAVVTSEALESVFPQQAFHLLDMKRYRPLYWHQWTERYEGGGYASVQTSLGCPFRCSFCCINAPFGGPSYRKWSPANVVQQIEHLVGEYGITNIKIPDEMFVLDRKHVIEICRDLLDAKLGESLNMWAYARIDTVKDEEMLAIMRAAGFRWLGIGIESGSKHVRDGVEKGRFGINEIFHAVRRVENAGLHIGANYIFGLPDDTRESMNETLGLACELNTSHANFYCAMAYPGSPLHRTAQQKGWPLPESKGGPGWIGYSQHSYHSRPLPTETLSSEEVLDYRDNAFMAYHSRPEHSAKLAQHFGPKAVEALTDILKLGMPRRAHRNP